MTRQLVRLITAGVVVVAGLGSSSPVAQAEVSSALQVPPVPANLEVPGGYSVFFKGHAVGTQNFVCLPSGSGAAWKFVGPQATLFQAYKGDLYWQLTTHFLAPNPSENGVARPSWQHSVDSSQVFGKVRESSNDPAYVEQGAIPWLLLDVAGARSGPAGGSFLTQTVFIHRLNTSGGLAPSTGCSQASEIGGVALVPYEADYFFYRAGGGR